MDEYYNTVLHTDEHYCEYSIVFCRVLYCLVLYGTVLTRVDPFNASENVNENMKYNTKNTYKTYVFLFFIIYYMWKKMGAIPPSCYNRFSVITMRVLMVLDCN